MRAPLAPAADYPLAVMHRAVRASDGSVAPGLHLLAEAKAAPIEDGLEVSNRTRRIELYRLALPNDSPALACRSCYCVAAVASLA